jgi:hypothetical protein
LVIVTHPERHVLRDAMINKNQILPLIKTAIYSLFILLTRNACVAMLLLLVLDSSFAAAQKLNLNYKVVNNGNTIGWVKIQKIDNGGASSIVLTSQVKRRIIFLLTVDEKQDAYFNEKGMINSSIYRKVNDNVKMDQQTIFKGNYYEVKNPKTSEKLLIKQVQYNLLSMYIKEPINIDKVFSETFQRYLTIEPQGKSVYKLKQPDGNVNYYHYENGTCSKVVMEHSLFTIEFVRI